MTKRIIFIMFLIMAFLQVSFANQMINAQDKQETKEKMQGTEASPVAIKRVNPIYPDSARKSGIEGKVDLQVYVGEKGFVKEVKVLKNESGSELLENAAMKAALDWQFQPVIKDGKAVGVYVTLPFNFKLSKDGKK